MTATLSPFPVFRAFDSDGAPLAGGKLYSYRAGTSTPLYTYVDSSETVGSQNTNPVILDSSGQANVWLGSAYAYKLVLTDKDDVPQWSVDNIESTLDLINTAIQGVYTNLANTTDIAEGDALIGVKQPFTGAVSRTQHEKNIDEKRQRVEWARKDLETRESSYWGDPDVLQAELEAMILAGSENYGKPSGYGAGHVWRSPPPDLLVPTGRSVDGYADSRNAYEIYGARADGVRGTALRDDLTMVEPDADGVWRWQTRRHILGESLIVADVQAWRGGKRIKRRNVKFLSGFDHGEPHLAYFFCEMPKCDAATVDEAYEALKPDAVRLAEQMERDIVRQGDIFAIATSYQRRDLLKQAKRHGYRNVPKRIKTWGDDNKLTPEYLRTERASMLLGTNHQGTEVIHANDGTIYARGCLWHVPDGRTNDHVRKKLGDGKTWYIILKNTVPVRKTR